MPARSPAKLLRPAQVASFAYGSVEFTADDATEATAEAIRQEFHPGVYGAFILCWTALFGIVAFTFLGSPFTMLVIAVGTLAVFLLSRVRPRDGGAVTFRDFLRGKFDTLTGPVRGWEALLHVILAPAAMSLATLVMAFIVNASRIAS
jgi:hypothetical protein